MGTAKCGQSTVGSLLLDSATGAGGGGLRLWPLFSAAAFRRKLADALICGVSRHRRKGDNKGCRTRAPARQGREVPPPSPPRQAGPDRLSELLKAELSSESESDEGEAEAAEAAEAEARRKVGVLEQLQGVVKRLQRTVDAQGEGGDQWKEAAKEVRRLAKGDAEARETLAMLGAIPPLVGMLDLADADIQVESLYALLNLGIGNDMNKAAIVAAGALHKMLRLIDTGSAKPVASEAIAANFLALSALDSNKPIIGASGAIPFLVETYRNADPSNAQARRDALRALFNLSIAPANIPRLVGAGLVPDLLAAVGDMGVTDRALAVLSNVVSTAEGRRAVSRSPEAFPILVDVLGWSDAPGCQEQAAYLLMVVAHKGRREDRAAMIAAGAVSTLLELALVGTPLAQKRASRVLECLSLDKGKQVSEGFEVGGGERSAAPAVSAPQCAVGAAEEEEGMSEERRAVRQLVQQSLQSNMRRIARRANLPQDLAPADHMKTLGAAAAAASTSKSVPF